MSSTAASPQIISGAGTSNSQQIAVNLLFHKFCHEFQLCCGRLHHWHPGWLIFPSRRNISAILRGWHIFGWTLETPTEMNGATRCISQPNVRASTTGWMPAWHATTLGDSNLLSHTTYKTSTRPSLHGHTGRFNDLITQISNMG
jgi:hypothetical protein